MLLTVGRSLIYIRHNNGPNTDPRGTPVVIEALFDFMPKYFTKEYIIVNDLSNRPMESRVNLTLYY